MKRIKKQVFDYLKYCDSVRNMSPTTVSFKRFVLGKFIETTSLSDLRKLDNKVFNEWVLTEVNRGVSARSLNTYNSIILSMVRYYIESGMTIPLKIKLIQKMNEEVLSRKFYSRDEIEKVISVANDEINLMIRIMFETGMRIAELARLKVSNFKGRKVQFIGKGRKVREAYIGEETYRLLVRFIDERKVEEYLWGFETLNGEPPTVNTVRNRLKKEFLAAGFKGFYPHALRHSFATYLQVKGASVVEIKEMMGHESIATTERYLHGFEGRLEELFDKYR